jgi:hypothetical protein
MDDLGYRIVPGWHLLAQPALRYVDDFAQHVTMRGRASGRFVAGAR